MTKILDCAVSTTCPFCGEEHIVFVNEDDFNAWQNGELAQNAFPYLTADSREMLISGICPDCWNGMFGSGEDHFENFIEEDDE